MKRWFFSSFLLLLIVGLFLWQPSEFEPIKLEWKIGDHPPLVMGVIPYQSKKALKREFDPLIEYLSLNLKKTVSLKIASDYENLGKLLDLERVQIAWFSATSFERLNRKNSWESICRPIRENSVYYRGVLIARADRNLKTLEDLREKTFAYVDRNSGSGFVYPNKLFKEHGIDPLHFFGEIVFTGNHTHSYAGVLSGKFDAAVIYDRLNVIASDVSTPPDIAVIARTGWILNDPVVVRKDFNPELKSQFTKLMIDMADFPGGKKAIESLSYPVKFYGFMSEKEIQESKPPE